MKISAMCLTILAVLSSAPAFAADWSAIECQLTTGNRGAQPSVVSASASINRSSMTNPSSKETIGNFKIENVDFTLLVSTYLGTPVLSVGAYLPESGGMRLSGSSDGSSVDFQILQPGDGHLRAISCRMK